jgi:hypothetical protein
MLWIKVLIGITFAVWAYVIASWIRIFFKVLLLIAVPLQGVAACDKPNQWTDSYEKAQECSEYTRPYDGQQTNSKWLESRKRAVERMRELEKDKWTDTFDEKKGK